MAALEIPHDDVLAQLTRALASLEKVRVRWRRYPDTAPLASAAEPAEAALRAIQAVAAPGGGLQDLDTLEFLRRAIMMLRVMQRDELLTIIESLQAAMAAVH